MEGKAWAICDGEIDGCDEDQRRRKYTRGKNGSGGYVNIALGQEQMYGSQNWKARRTCMKSTTLFLQDGGPREMWKKQSGTATVQALGVRSRKYFR